MTSAKGHRTGFTLIELLVVISVIAILLSILLPSLTKAKNAAATVVCQTRLKQWGTALHLYTTDYKGSYEPGPGGFPLGQPERRWMELLLRYYTADPTGKDTASGQIRCCPKATLPIWDWQGRRTAAKQPFAAWGIFPGDNTFQLEGHFGSYGMNWWLCNNTRTKTGGNFYPGDGNLPKLWRRVENVKTPYQVPSFADSSYYGFWPEQYDMPPINMEDVIPSRGNQHYPDGVKRVCVNRHNKYAGVVFVDGSARRISLKRMWNLKWHRNYDPNSIRLGKPFPTFDSPQMGLWMRDFPD